MSQKGGMQTELIFTSYCEDRNMLARIEHPFPGRIELLADRNHFLESVLAWAELPAPEEWLPILALSQRENIPSVWKRAHPSTLEANAAALLTALAFSSSACWVDLIRNFFKAHSLERTNHGRPPVYIRDRRDFGRGSQIDSIARRLDIGFRLRSQAKAKDDFRSDDDEITAVLINEGYDPLEIQALLPATSLQDAACRYYSATEGKQLNISLKAIRNSYSRYKRSIVLQQKST